jgi:hypothetical protein
VYLICHAEFFSKVFLLQAAVISEVIMRLVNTAKGRSLTAALAFTAQALRGGQTRNARASSFFFSSDVLVAIEVMLRELANLPVGSPLLPLYVKCLDGALRWPEYRHKRHRAAEMLSLFHGLLANAKSDSQQDRELTETVIAVLSAHVDVLEQ